MAIGPKHKFILSPNQEQVVKARGSALQVIACAGSGKTESISRRVSAIISEGALPESIIAFTFTEKAAVELKDRIYKRVEEVKGTDFLGRLGPMFVGTIHGYLSVARF
jgi:DNA helicase-2/ATP-dependent DNA helicase PcrA